MTRYMLDENEMKNVNCLFVCSFVQNLLVAGSHRNTHSYTRNEKKGTLQQQQQQQQQQREIGTQRRCYIYHPFIPFYIPRPHISTAIVSHPTTQQKTHTRLPASGLRPYSLPAIGNSTSTLPPNAARPRRLVGRARAADATRDLRKGAPLAGWD